MPLVIMCGFPCSGKTSVAKRLQRHLEEVEKRRVVFLDDWSCLPSGRSRAEVLGDTGGEKQHRSGLKSEVQRCLDQDHVVIIDSGNYIKGYRYELFCITKSAQTPQCVIFCDVTKDTAREINTRVLSEVTDANTSSSSSPLRAGYPPELLEALMMRFEAPVGSNRWDSPLFTVQDDREAAGDGQKLNLEAVCDALLRRKAPPANQSTQSQPLSETNFLQELDRVTQEATKHVMKEQNSCVPGSEIYFPGATESLRFTRRLTLAELQRCRRQFISFAKSRPTSDLKQCLNMYIQYLGNTLT